MGLRDRLKEKATEAAAVASEKARDVAEIAGERASPKLRALVKMEEDEPITPEAFVVRLVDAIRRDEDVDLSEKDLTKRAKRRQRVASAAGALGGPPGLRVAGLYCEAAVLCDVAELHDLELTDEQLASHLLVIWRLAPDAGTATAAIDGTGPPVTSLLGEAAKDKLGIKPREEMRKRDTVMVLWRSRGIVDDVVSTDSAGARDIVLPGKRVKQLTEAAEGQLEV